MRRANDLTDGYCLAMPDDGRCVFYKEDTQTITMDFSKARGAQPAVAVDTAKRYHEIDIGPLDPRKHTWKAPHESDWAIAIGQFGGGTEPPTNSAEKRTNAY